ncbi:MAG: hypothetical protein O3A55_01230 [Bacteroidetes bacterium]|nr:hypothetical protein [Bacteroidota bacterium]
MNWIDEVNFEKNRALKSNHKGKIRVAARRMVLIAVKEFYNKNINDAILALEEVKNQSKENKFVEDAAARLITRLDNNFLSPSVEPIKDAEIIISFISNNFTSLKRDK